MNEKISIVVPVYNAALFLPSCLDSIVKQTYPFFEVLLIDDGSTDDSLRTCNKYCDKDDRFIVYSIKHSGPSAARNFGITKCTANWVTYIDSDDFVADVFLETLIDNKDKYGADISVVGMLRTKNYSYKHNYNRTRKVFSLSGMDAIKNMLYQQDIDTSPCALLFKKGFAIDCPFPEGKYHEDDFIMYKYYEKSGVVVIDTLPLYYYVQHRNSIMHRNGVINYDEIEASDKLVDHFMQFGDEQLYRAAISKKYSNYCQVLMKCSNMRETDKELYYKIVSFLKENADGIIDNKQTRGKNKMAAWLIKIGGVRALLVANRIFH